MSVSRKDLPVRKAPTTETTATRVPLGTLPVTCGGGFGVRRGGFGEGGLPTSSRCASLSVNA